MPPASRGDVRERRTIEHRTIDHTQSLLASAAADDPCLFPLLSRSHQCRLCGAHHEQGSGARCRYLWHGGWRFLLGLFFVRSAEQHHPGKARRAHLDRPHHGDLGLAVGRYGIFRRPVELSHHALSARPRRGWAFPGHDLVFHLLVPGLASRPHRVRLHGGAAACGCRRCADVDCAAWVERAVGSRRLAGCSSPKPFRPSSLASSCCSA